MKAISILAFSALIALAISAGAAYAADCCPRTCPNTTCPDCQAPAWDRTPLCEIRASECATCPVQPPRVVIVDPWTRCGAFCAAGQIPNGWPYGWNAPYWLRPDTNY